MPQHPQAPADPNQLIFQELVQAIQQQQQHAQQQPRAVTGILEPGQEGVADALRNPSQAQRNAILAGILGTALPNSRAPLLSGAATGLSALQQQRARDLSALQEAHAQRTEALQQRIENIVRVGNMSSSIQSGQRDEARLGLAMKSEERAAGPQDRVNLVTAGGQLVGEALVGPNQRLFRVDPQTGDYVDITQQVAQQGYLTQPKSSQTINIDMGREELVDMLNEQTVDNLGDLREKAQQGRSKVSIAEQMLQLAPRVTSGVGAQLLTDFKSLVRTGLQEAGLTPLAERIDTADAEQMAGLSSQAMIPFIEAQGRSFSDQDRKATQAALPGLRNSPQANIALGNIMKASGFAAQDEFNFHEEVVRRVAANERENTTGASREYSQYVQDVPRLKLGENGVPQAVDTRAPIWQYWVGGRPKKFVLQGAEGTGELTQDQLREEAEQRNMSYRELLGELERQGVILGVQR